MSKILFICRAVKWRDKVNGNTYHSVRITRTKDGEVSTAGFQYGYGDAYRQTALAVLALNGWIPEKYRDQNSRYLYERENNYPIYWEEIQGTKKDCKDNGIL